ncbi:hypothetical protein [Enterococcus mundtii]|uniref:hypothetical protein n=1 Tax=Enterococcus mundtii TaxID=53346 RepID=UPI0035C6DC94
MINSYSIQRVQIGSSWVYWDVTNSYLANSVWFYKQTCANRSFGWEFEIVQ